MSGITLSERVANLSAQIEALRESVNGLRADVQRRNELSEQRLNELEKCRDDHELRLREASQGVTQLKVWSGLSSGGTGILSIIAMLKSFLGSP